MDAYTGFLRFALHACGGVCIHIWEGEKEILRRSIFRLVQIFSQVIDMPSGYEDGETET